MKRLIIFSLISIFVLSSCSYVTGERIGGNGDIKRELRSTEGFSGVDISGAIHLIVTQDSISRVEIETDANLFQYIEVKTDGDELVIATKRGYQLDPTKSIKAYVSAPSFKTIDASGACTVRSANQLNSSAPLRISLSGATNAIVDTRCPEVRSELSGASELTLRGQTKDTHLEASGSSRIEAFDLLAENAIVDISGASHADVFASVKIDADASGASTVRYRGNAPTVTSDVSGASSVRKAD